MFQASRHVPIHVIQLLNMHSFTYYLLSLNKNCIINKHCNYKKNWQDMLQSIEIIYGPLKLIERHFKYITLSKVFVTFSTLQKILQTIIQPFAAQFRQYL